MSITRLQRPAPEPPVHPVPGHPRPGHPDPGPGRPEPQRWSPPAPQLLPAAAGVMLVHPLTAVDPVLDRLLDERIVYLGGELDAAAADRLVTQFLLLGAQDGRRDIIFYINSTGGSATAAMAVHDTMQAVAPDVATWAVGLAGSMGQFLLTAGAAGKRHALPHARIQLAEGMAPDVAVRAGVSGAIRREVAELTARRTRRPVETIIADSGRGRWFTAAQARDHGLLDHVSAPTAPVGGEPR